MLKKSLTDIERNLKILDGQAKLDQKKTILDIITALDKELENSDHLPKQLVHFLKHRSYRKALNFIHNEYEKTGSN